MNYTRCLYTKEVETRRLPAKWWPWLGRTLARARYFRIPGNRFEYRSIPTREQPGIRQKESGLM